MVQINGKVRDRIKVPSNSKEDELRQIALENSRILELTKDKEIVKIIIIANKLINIVVK